MASKEKLGGMSKLSKLLSSAGKSPRQEPSLAAAAAAPPKPAVSYGRPSTSRLSRYVSKRAFDRPEGVGVQEVLRALAEAARSGDKSGRQQLVALLLRLFFFEELPPEAMQQLMPLFQAQGKDVRTLRSLYYLAEVYVCCGSAGSPTLYDPNLVGKRPDDRALQLVLAEVWRLLETPALDPAVARATFFLAAAAARNNAVVRKQLVAQVQRAIAAADQQAGAAGPLGNAPRRSAATDWDLQHTAFATSRLAGSTTGADEISRSFAVGVGSGDAVGARHALALGLEVAQRDASYVVREMQQAVAEAAQQYDAAGPAPVRVPGQGVNLEDSLARLYLARLCALVVHSDQSATDVSRDGAPFWSMLCLLATRDPVDMVRFGAIEAMTGVLASSSAALSGASKLGSSSSSTRDETVQRQRRARAWRLLVAQSGMPVTVPGATEKGAMKLIDVLGRLLLSALRRAGSAARFCVAAGAVASLAESCLASQAAGGARHGSSADVDRVLGVLAGELGGLVEASLRAAQRCAVIEALLYLQAAGYATNFTPAKLVQAGGGGTAWTGGMQDALLTAVLKCAKAKPKEAATFLGYATAVVGIAPSGIDLAKITDLWDAEVGAGQEGRAAVLEVVMAALHSPPPPSTQARAGSGGAEVTRAAQEEDGWNSFVSTAAWWLGENANGLCEEYCGRQLTPAAIPGGSSSIGGASSSRAAAGGGGDDEADGGGDDDADESDDREVDAAAAAAAAAAASASELMQQFGGRSPTLSRIMLALQNLMLTAVWQLRLAAAQALAKIAVRTGEPYRLQCYSILAAACSAGGGADALGLHSSTRPALALLDKMYAAQVVLDQLWDEHGEDVEAWPKDVVASLGRRNAELARQAERYVCSVPRDRYSLLGHRATLVLATGDEAGDYFSSFVKTSEAQEAKSDRTGDELAANKSRELDKILGSASEDGGSLTCKMTSALGEPSATLDDRNKEIDRLLSGGGAVDRQASEPWGFSGAGSGAYGGGGNYNAFAEGSELAGGGASSAAQETTFPMVSSPAGDASAANTPRFGGGGSGGAADWGQQATSPDSASAASGGAWFAGGEQAGGPAKGGVGTGTVLHTFVGDYNQPEELSVFEGDTVEVLEEADGWMLVRDPGGREGLVPTAYLQLDTLYPQKLQSAAAAEAAAAAAEYLRKASGSTPTRAHRRGASVDYGQSKEDLLDNIFSNYSASPMPSMPEEQPASFAEGASLFGGGAYSSAGGGVSEGADAATTGSLAPVQRQDSFPAPTGRTDSMWAAQPLRQESLVQSSDYRDSAGVGANGASPQGQGITRQASNAAAGPSSGRSPSHRRTASAASSGGHRRTLSAASSGGVGGFDAYDLGSIPNTPGRVEGPERGIVAGFVGELEGELSVDPGDRVKVHSEVDGWARVIRLGDNRTGLVPSWAVGGD